MSTSTATDVRPKTLRTWIDENTGRQLTQITDFPHGAGVGYFRTTKHLPDGRVLAKGYSAPAQPPTLLAIDAATGDVEELKQPFSSALRVRPEDGRAWFMGGKDHRELWEVDLPYGTPKKIGSLPTGVPGSPASITCDGRVLICEEYRDEHSPFPIPTGMDAGELWRYINRPRSGAIYAYDVAAGRVGRLVSMAHLSPAHSDASPVDPTLLRYTEDVLEATGQRMFTIHTDGSQPRPLRRQEYGEMITHEFWWADPQLVGYTYMDRRGDATLLTHPWCEYATCATHLGICDLNGREVYRSDPLNSYHAHLYMSPDGSIVSGEGTAWNCFACAAPFSMGQTRLEMVRLATIHTAWVPTRGQGVNCAFSGDSKWMLYNDLVDGKRQICRVKVDV